MSIIAQAAQNDKTKLSINGKEFTNNHGVPFETSIFAAYHSTLYSGGAPRVGKLSTTTLIGPLRKALYGMLQAESTEPQDVNFLLASAKGTCMHEGMTRALTAYNSGYVCEQRIETEVEGWKISGEFDILTPDKQIKDLKFVSNYNLKKLQEDMAILEPGMSLEEMYEQTPTYFKYQAQLSVYYYLLNDPEVKPYASILFSLNNGSDMGKYKVDQEVVFPLWPREATEEFITNRVKLLKQHLTDGTMPLCSDSERGYTPAEYKLQRVSPTNGKLSTVRGSKFDNYTKFREFVMKSGKLGDVEQIQDAKYTLCNYCNYSSICTQE
jgi:hypothetical protein